MLASAAALQLRPARPLRRLALQRRINREADWISNPARGLDPECLQQDDSLDVLVRKHNNLVEELKALDAPPAAQRATAAAAGPNSHRVPIHARRPKPRKAVQNFMKMPPRKKSCGGLCCRRHDRRAVG
jgi:hypothetical protein